MPNRQLVGYFQLSDDIDATAAEVFAAVEAFLASPPDDPDDDGPTEPL